MASFLDLALYDRTDRLAAVAEVKNKLGTSHEWAARTRRNILAHGGLWDTEFFLLVTPDRLYLWKDAGTAPTEIPPTYVADTQSEFEPYFERAGVEPHNVSGAAFEMLVGSWLGDLIRSEGGAGESADPRGWLVRSGFSAAVKDGRIRFEAAPTLNGAVF